MAAEKPRGIRNKLRKLIGEDNISPLVNMEHVARVIELDNISRISEVNQILDSIEKEILSIQEIKAKRDIMQISKYLHLNQSRRRNRNSLLPSSDNSLRSIKEDILAGAR
jgi:hypothetical protein